MTRAEWTKFAKELEKVCAKHGVQPSRDYEYNEYSFQEYEPGLADELLDAFDRAEDLRIRQKQEDEERDARRAICASKGHWWQLWALRSNTSVGDIEVRSCTQCYAYEQREFKGWTP